MAEHNKFGQSPDPGPHPGGLRCDDWELLLADALDGMLGAREAAAFEAHCAGCPGCADLLAHAKQGQEWLGYLHSDPEVPAGLVSRILEKTAGAGAVPVPVLAGTGMGTGVATATAIPMRRSFHETRLLMTVAMAFFSIALTLNMAGVKLTNLRMADLRPSQIGSTLSREFYGARGSVVRFYDNMRFVYQVESKMRELRRDTESPATQRTPKPNGRNDSAPPPPSHGEILSANARAQSTNAQTVQHIAQTEQQNSSPCALPHSNQSIAVSEPSTEVKYLTSLGIHRAGPRWLAATAGYEGRSLA